MIPDENNVNDVEPATVNELDLLLQQALDSLSSGGTAGEEPVVGNLQLLADLQKALGTLEDRLRSEPKDEIEDSGSTLQQFQEDPLAPVFENLPTPLAVIDTEGRFERANPALIAVFGFDPTGLNQAEVIEKTTLCWMDGSPVPVVASAASRALLGEKVSGERCRFTSLSGDPFEAIASATPLLRGDQINGAVLLWHPFVDEGTEQQETPPKEQEQLDRSRDCEAILEAVLDYLPLGLIITDGLEGKVRMVSKKAELHLSQVIPQIEGARWEELLAGWQGLQQDSVSPVEMDDLPPNRILRSGEVIREEEWDFQGFEGQKNSIVISGGPIKDSQGGIRGGVLIWQDVSEQKLSDARLRESEASERARAAELEAVLDAVPATVWIAKDPECREVVGNRHSYDMLRMPYGANQSKSVPEGEATAHFRVFQDGEELAPEDLPLQVSASQGIEIRDFEEEIVFDDGVVRSVIGNVTPLFDEEDRPRGAIAAFVDITRRVQAEEALRKAHDELEDRVKERTEELVLANRLLSDSIEQQRKEISERQRAEAALGESKALFERLIQLAPDPIVLLDERDRILELNVQATFRLGYNLEELVGEPFEKLLPESLHTPFKSWRSEQEGNSDPHLVLIGQDLYAQRKDGERIPVDITINSIQVEGRQKTICIIHDITPRKQIEDALRQSEARFRAIFEQSPVGIQLLDLDGNNLEWNPRFQEMVGYEADELRRMTYLDYTYEEDVERNRKLFEDLVNGKLDHYSIEKRFNQKNGQVLWRRLYVSLAREMEGLPLFIVKVVEDIDERKGIEAELAEVQRRLIDSNETERLLIARELHDGPLQEIFALNYNLSSLNLSLEDNNQKAELNAVQNRLMEVNQVLRSIMRELRPPALSPFGLEKAILDHADQLQQRYPHLAIKFDLMPDGVSLPERERLALFRIYQAALSNVTRHSQATHVEIRLVLTVDEVALEVRDDGVGFEVPERWIGMVRQGHYGLVGAVERAEAIGGRLQISSKPGEGTLLRVVVPRGKDL